MNDDVFEQARLFLPKYLTPEQQNELFSELKKFPDNFNFYLRRPDLQNEILQGDGWRGFLAINFDTTEKKPVSGVVLSNSCDVNPENRRAVPVNVLFSPMIRLAGYAGLLKKTKSEDQMERILSDIRHQRVTSIFYLPGDRGNMEDSIILLDNIHAHPLADFSQQSRSKLFTLSQYAFYLFLMKLSIHFSRFQEGVARFDTVG